MRLVRLTGLERDKINNEYKEKMALIKDLTDILARPERIDQIIEEELTEVKEKYGDERRTELLVGEALSLEDEDLIDEEEITILLTEDGYVKRMPSEEFKSQNRGGRGMKGITTHDEDYVSQILTCSTHDLILSFTNKGKIYRVKGYEIPEYGRSAKGLPIINIMNIDSDEHIEAMVGLEDKPQGDEHLFFVTKNGTVKRTLLEEFRNIRTSGIIAIKLSEDDELIDVFITQGEENVIIGTQQGYAVTFNERDVRSMGRNTTGVRGANLREGDQVIGASPLPEGSQVLVVSEKGYGKCTSAEEYPIRGRGGKGIITLNITEKNGPLKAIITVDGQEDILVVTSEGIMIRFGVENVSTTGRATQGVRLVRMDEDVHVTTAEKLIISETEENIEENSEDGDQ
jgi:DNA gyrase subunit A